MNKLFILCCSLVFITSGCNTKYDTSIIIEKPKHRISEMLVVIEEPNFSVRGKEKNGVLEFNPKAQTSLELYKLKFSSTTKSNFVKVMKDNGITTKLIFVPSGSSATTQPLKLITKKNRDNWNYILWMRHTKGMYRCRKRICNSYFLINSKLYDLRSDKLVWATQESGKVYYGVKPWKDGVIYENLLESLSNDGIIDLKGKDPLVVIDSK